MEKETEYETYDYSKLRGKIKEIYNTQDAFAEKLGIGRVTLSSRLNNSSDFSQTEMFKACRLLSIDLKEVSAYFFTLKVQKDEHKRL